MHAVHAFLRPASIGLHEIEVVLSFSWMIIYKRMTREDISRETFKEAVSLPEIPSFLPPFPLFSGKRGSHCHYFGV